MKVDKFNTSLLKKLPNLISFIRIIIAIYLAIRFYLINKIDVIFISLFLVAIISDKLDGYYAKKLNAITNFGKLLDPIADKILTFVIILIFYYRELLPIWAIYICILKDIGLSIYRYIKLKRGIIVGALKLGRYKTAYNLLVFGIVLLTLLNTEYMNSNNLGILKVILITTIL